MRLRVIRIFALLGLSGILLFPEGCRKEREGTDAGEMRSPAAKIPGKRSASGAPVFSGALSRSASAASVPERAVSSTPVRGTSLEEARAAFENPVFSDSVRLAAAGRLLEMDPGFLAGAYGRRDNARILRRLIEERVERRDVLVVPLLVGLFERVGGEERIDFEAYLLRFGRRAESAVMGFLHARDRSLVMRAMDTLVKMRSPAAADSIAPLLAHPDSWIRIGAAHALGELGGERAAERLEAVLDDTVYSVVDAALVGLGRLRAVSAYDRIVPLLRSDIPHVRKHAAMALGEIGDERAVPLIRDLARNDPDPGVRFMAGKALEKLEKKR